MDFLRSRHWRIGRRVALVVIALVIGYRTYGDAVRGWFTGPDPTADIVVVRSEFRPDIDPDRPMWFIWLRNTSRQVTYDRIVLEAAYFDGDGEMVDTDHIVVNQRLLPGSVEEIGSPDPEIREGATRGSLTVVDAAVVE